MRAEYKRETSEPGHKRAGSPLENILRDVSRRKCTFHDSPSSPSRRHPCCCRTVDDDDDALFIIVPLQAATLERIRYPGEFALGGPPGKEEGTPIVIEIGPADTVSLVARIAVELFAGSRSSEWRIKGERVRRGESGGNYNGDVYRRRRRKVEAEGRLRASMTVQASPRDRGGGGITAEAEIVISLEAAGIWISKAPATAGLYRGIGALPERQRTFTYTGNPSSALRLAHCV